MQSAVNTLVTYKDNGEVTFTLNIWTEKGDSITISGILYLKTHKAVTTMYAVMNNGDGPTLLPKKFMCSDVPNTLESIFSGLTYINIPGESDMTSAIISAAESYLSVHY